MITKEQIEKAKKKGKLSSGPGAEKLGEELPNEGKADGLYAWCVRTGVRFIDAFRRLGGGIPVFKKRKK